MAEDVQRGEQDAAGKQPRPKTAAEIRRRNRRSWLFLVAFGGSITLCGAAIVTYFVYNQTHRTTVVCTAERAQQTGTVSLGVSVKVDTVECGALGVDGDFPTTEDGVRFANSLQLGEKYEFDIGVLSKWRLLMSKVFPPIPNVTDPRLVEE